MRAAFALAALFLVPLAAGAQADQIASIAWTHTALGEGWGFPAWVLQCFEVSVDAGAGATMSKGRVYWGDSATRHDELPFTLDPDGRGSAELCHGFPPSIVPYQVSLVVELADGRYDLDCLDVHGQLGTNEPYEGCETT